MTFHKNAIDEDQHQQHHQDAQQIFALNLKSTQVGKTPKKSTHQLDEIQELKNQRKIVNKKKLQVHQEHSSSSSQQESDESDEDAGDKSQSKVLGRLDTGNFSKIEKHEFNSKLLSESLQQSSKASIQQHLAAFPRQDSFKK